MVCWVNILLDSGFGCQEFGFGGHDSCRRGLVMQNFPFWWDLWWEPLNILADGKVCLLFAVETMS